MRIAIVTETFYPATDGICTRLANFVVGLRDLGHQVIVISPDLGIKDYQGIPVYTIDSINLPLYGTRKWGKPSRQVKGILQAFKPDVIHAVNPISLAVAGIYYGNQLGIPVMASYHTHLPEYLDHYRLGLLKPALWDYIRYWHQQVDLNITVSEALKLELENQNIPVKGVIPRGISIDQRDPKFFDESLYKQLTFNELGNKLLVYVGRLAAEKDLHHLRRIFDYRDDICLAFVGDGPQREELEAIFRGTKTTFLGFKRGEDLAKCFATGDAFIFPSTSETFGLVISEAMASGQAVIAAASQPTLEQIEPFVTGLVYESGNTAQMMKMINYLDDRDMMDKLGHQARLEAEQYTWDKATQRLLGFYQETIDISCHKESHPGRIKLLENILS